MKLEEAHRLDEEVSKEGEQLYGGIFGKEPGAAEAAELEKIEQEKNSCQSHSVVHTLAKGASKRQVCCFIAMVLHSFKLLSVLPSCLFFLR